MADKYYFKFNILAIIALFCSLSIFSQSSDPFFPKPLVEPEITAIIKPRSFGDSRPTTYYYTFEGGQGDLFINVQAQNFSGDIDLFIQQGQIPLAKIIFYSDNRENETGRVIYLRKPEKLLLRVQGRTPNDDDAVLRIKFAGGFIASKETEGPPAPSAASIRIAGQILSSESRIHKNADLDEDNRKISGREILANEIGRRMPELAIAPITQIDNDKTADKTDKTDVPAGKNVSSQNQQAEATTDIEQKQPEREAKTQSAPETPKVVVTDPFAEKDDKAANRNETEQQRDQASADQAVANNETSTENATAKARTRKQAGNAKQTGVSKKKKAASNSQSSSTAQESEPEISQRADNETNEDGISESNRDKASQNKNRVKSSEEILNERLEKINLVVKFKDGGVIELPMSQINRFSVERGILIIIYRSGRISRYNIIEVDSVTIK
ncbi:MAG TPA: hypothetical protein VNK26_05380 [Pyrinomonadaceae bacterium]|nr:hypothetical protein [Pyrinomonadaceae bacterium]